MIPYIIPAVMRGNRIKKAINRTKWSSTTQYTIRNPTEGSVRVFIAVDIHNHNGKRGKHGRWRFGYVVSRISWTPRKIQDVYKKRFAIKASYRMRNIVRPRTSSRDPKFRYLLALISMELKYVWVILKRKHFTKK